MLGGQFVGVVLEVPDDDNDMSSATEIRIVTDLVFHEGNVRGVSKGWYASTMLAVEAPACKHATEKYVAASTGSRLEIKIASGAKKARAGYLHQAFQCK